MLMAVSGTAGVAFTTFVIAFLLIKTATPAQFGIFSFQQAFVALCFGLSNALLGSPLMVAVNREGKPFEALAQSFGQVSLFLALFVSLITLGLILQFGESLATAFAFALSSIFLMVRWFGRSLENAAHRPDIVVRSDAVFVCVLLLGCLVLFMLNAISLKSIAYLQMGSALAGVLALSRTSLEAHIKGFLQGKFTHFTQAFKSQGRHALVGVLTTEGTTNAHIYLVTGLLGPAAYAPLAVAVLLYRPVPLVIMSLTQLERPRIAKMLASSDIKGAWQAVSLFRLIVLGFWLVNVMFAGYLLLYWMVPLGMAAYDPKVIHIAALFWALIMGLRCLRGPESALLQADGRFKELSRTTIISCVVSIPVVLAVLLYSEAVFSLTGILLGEIVATLLIMRLTRKRISVKVDKLYDH